MAIDVVARLYSPKYLYYYLLLNVFFKQLQYFFIEPNC